MAKPPKVRQRARRDVNHNLIVRIFESLGAGWLETSAVAGALDGIVGCCGIDQRVEIKDGDKPASERTLTTPESEVFDTWPGRRPVVVETAEDAIELIYTLRRESIEQARKKPARRKA